MGFGTTLRAALDARGPLCAGIDPHAALLSAWGFNDDAAGCEKFALTVVEALGERVAAVKPQSAFFERFGSAGIAALERTVAAAREAGAVVILDVKRGDVGSTAQAYAQAYLTPGAPLRVDALTVNPYLGFGALRPFVETALASGSGVFVLALTSNPEGAAIQHAVRADGRTVAQALVEEAAAVNATEIAHGAPLGSVGLVVGATIGQAGRSLSGLSGLGGPILVPGLGAQGATPADLRTVFGDQVGNLLPAMSRDLLRHGPDIAALRSATDRALDELRTALARVP